MYRKYKYQSRSKRKQITTNKSKNNKNDDEDIEENNDSKKEAKIEYHIHNYHVAAPTFPRGFCNNTNQVISDCNEHCCPQSYVECINQKRCYAYNNPYYNNACSSSIPHQNRCNYNYNNACSISQFQNRCNLSPVPLITTPRQIMNSGNLIQFQERYCPNFY